MWKYGWDNKQIWASCCCTKWKQKTRFKDIQRNTATNWTIKDVERNIDLFVASGKLENRPTAKGLESFFIVKTTHTIYNVNDDNREVSNNTFSSELVHEIPMSFFVESPEFSNDVNRHLQENFT